ncbi:MAG: chemotaxis protein CheW [Sedimentisphaerales bacterium]|nr:chemotaxis protein CheW [Sedimentisphaerales bacterium]
MSNDNAELFASFVEEANEFLADVENDFLSIEEAGEQVDKELVNKVFRGIHSMKGSAGFLGLTSIGTLAHEMENVLNLIRGGELVPSSGIIDSLLKGADVLRTMVNHIDTSNDVDVSGNIKNLKAALSGKTTEEVKESLNRDVDISLPNGSLAFVMLKEMELVLRQRQGCHIYVAEVDFFADVHAKGSTPMEFLQNVYQYGELIDSYLSTAGIGDLSSDLPASMMFMIVLGSKLNQEELADALKLPVDQVHHIATPEQTLWESSGPIVPQGQNNQESAGPETAPESSESQPHQGIPNTRPKTESDRPATQAEGAGTTQVQTSLRVNVKVLDTLMNLAGELVLGRNQLLQEADSRDQRGIESVAARIDQITSELQEAIMQTRMQPIGTVFNKFPRVVRDLSSKLGKQSELIIEGKDVEMDKTIIEAIGDPLTHLVRNSIDHGIETPDIRTACGKNIVGKVVLRAYHQAGKVNIAISDDGAGIDGSRLKEKAVEKGLLTQDQAGELNHRDAIRLIFHPGFSMAQKVTDVSGRGVGMDVVKTNIERLGGTVDIETEIGVGTTIIVKMPLTLAIIPSLIVRCGEDKFALPQVNINELVRIKASEVSRKIERLKKAEVLRLRGTLLPLVRLSKALETQSRFHDSVARELKENKRVNIADRRKESPADRIPEVDEATPSEHIDNQREGTDRRENTAAGALNIIVVETGHFRYGLIVDELYDSKEIVVKPLGRHMKDCHCLAGATILGDGRVSLILDIAGIAGHMKLIMPETDESGTDKSNAALQGDETQSMLIFTNDPKEYFGVPTEFVSRIERIRTEQIDSVGGQEVLQYRGASLPLLNLESQIKARCRPQMSSVYVVVFKISRIEVGLIAPYLVDISEISTNIDTKTFRESGVVGSTILNDKTVRLVDVFELAEATHPEWFSQNETEETKKNKEKTILLVEDSSFFRQQMSNFLQTEGYEVLACEDGVIAWNTLRESRHDIGLVVTDIEMPKMNGLELARKIKADPAFSGLPVIAVTSLAGEDDIERGRQAGIDDYQVKLDREQLLISINRHLKQTRISMGS